MSQVPGNSILGNGITKYCSVNILLLFHRFDFLLFNVSLTTVNAFRRSPPILVCSLFALFDKVVVWASLLPSSD